MAKYILVVDDDPDIVEYMTMLLEDHNYRVRSANNGVEAMQSIKEEKPDLVLLDLEMPEETGTGLYRKLHGKKELKDIPIIIVSGLPGRNVAVSKSVVVIGKPFKEEEVLEEVKKALRRLTHLEGPE